MSERPCARPRVGLDWPKNAGIGLRIARLARHLRSNAVAYLALFVAMTSTSVAATAIQKNSVLSRHIKNGQVKGSDLAKNSVDTSKVRNATLRAEDFAANQLPVGPQGQQGPKGDTGQPGAPNPNADLLDGLNSDAFALAGHNHDAAYALAGHNHDAAYVNEGQADSVDDDMITDVRRSINLPLISFYDCDTDTGGFLDYNNVAGDALPDFVTSSTDGRGHQLEFDAGATPDEDTEICSTFQPPADYAGGGRMDLVVQKNSDSGAAESLRVTYAGNGGAPGTAATSDTGGFGTGVVSYGFGPSMPNGAAITVGLSVTAPGTMNDAVKVLSAAFTYESTQ